MSKFSAQFLSRWFGLGIASLILCVHPASAQTCASPANAIVAENCLTGNPENEWMVTGYGDATIQGFATEMSVNKGQTISFKVKTDASNYRLDVYRVGYYAGNGARKVATLTPSVSLPQTQPACMTEPSTGLVDCGNWTVSASWAVPANATSGLYMGRLVRTDNGGASHIPFVVRDDNGFADLLYQTSDTTWQAYNDYGGNSLYYGAPVGRAYKVSYNRPFLTAATIAGYGQHTWWYVNEYPMIRWLERNGYKISYSTGIDTDRSGSELLKHKVFISSGHDEYWSGGQRANVEAARDAGVNLAFFSGNEVFWKTRWESSIAGASTPYRTLVVYKETLDGAKIDPSSQWTGTWRDPRFSPPSDGGRPENSLTGTWFKVNCCEASAIQVPAAQGKLRFWRNTAFASLAPGQVGTTSTGVLGFESDEAPDNGFAPPGLLRLSSTTRLINGGYLVDHGGVYGVATATHSATLHRRPNGALVFASGTVRWSWGLEGGDHRDGTSVADVRMQQATLNLLADMGTQPGSMQSGLVAATASSDSVAPVSAITSPAAGSSVSGDVTVTGTASDAGGLLAAVEVSVDGGATWHLATGTTNWSYTWTTSGAGSATIKSRATDDSGNLEIPSAGITVTSLASSYPCTVWSSSTVPANPADTDSSALELGFKFRALQNGYITGVRFYKGTGNTGTHIGHLWSSTGTVLATATFTNETATGWQQVNFAAPVAITANTTYVASYFAPLGHYSYNSAFFTSAVVNGPLRALANGEDGGNGLYLYTASGGFPNGTWNSNNYWVDVVFSTTVGNQPPVAVADAYSAIQNQPLTVAAPGVLSNDSDPNGNPMTAIKVTNPTSGSVTLNTNGSFTYTPDTGFTGTDSFTYKANDGTVDSNIVTVTLTVNALPTASADGYSVNQAQTLTVAAPGVLGNDTGASITAIKLTNPVNGSVTLNANGSFTYIPNAAFTGTDSFTYKANNTTGDSNAATVTITVNAVPTATADSYTISAGLPTTISAPGVLGNDVSPGGLPLTAVKLTNPANGTVTLNANGSFTYTPNVGFSGTNSFTYQANNGTTNSNIATVTLTVLAIPVATNDTYSASTNVPLTVAAAGVLGNDTGLNLTAIKLSDPANGAVALNSNGSFTYTPNNGFSGTNTFTYKANNGLVDSNIATVTINVTTGPVASPDSYNATTAVALTIAAPGLLSNDTGSTLTAIKVTNPLSGTVTVNSNGGFTYTSNAGFTGTDSFTYKANNGSVDSNTTTVTITVNAAPVAVADIYSGASGQALTIAAPGLLSNDTSPGAIALTAIKVTNPANGTVTVNPNGGFTYTPNVGFVGTDSFTYKANNGTADSNTVAVTLCACTVWSSSTVPANPADTDSSALELGFKFRTTQNGYITGVRFYKGTGNTGTHIGHLWSSNGTILATATFTNETATGWQQVNFASPVAITANTTYVASYFAPLGHYSYNSAFFTSAVVNGPLRALANGEDGGNGLYLYAPNGGFPVNTWNSNNYWVDVVFSTVP